MAIHSLTSLNMRRALWGLGYKGTYKVKYHKNAKLNFETLNFI